MDQTNAKNGSWMEATKFVNLVNQVMEMHQGPSVNKFIIRFSSLGRAGHDPICDWIRFAMQKEVRVLELISLGHIFPDLEKFLAISATVKPKSSLVSLTTFKLVNISIRDNMIEYLLSNCPHLEQLYIHGGCHIKNLNIVSQSLKSLTLRICWNLEKLKISAANLVSFEYLGPPPPPPPEPNVHIRFQNVPLLSELTIDGMYFESFIFKPHRHVKYRGQLEKLVLNLPRSVVGGMVNFTYVRAIPKLRCLKHLELVIRTEAGESLLFFILLTTRCPFLSTFAVKFIYERKLSKQEMASALLRYRKKRSRLNSYQHEHLKLVKLMDFAGYRSDFRFTLALLHISKSLQKLIINFGYNPQRVATARERAKQLEASLPAGAELVII